MGTAKQQVSGEGSEGATSLPEWIPFRDGEEPPSAKGRFDIEILSVYYFPEGNNVCAAVVLKTSFILREGRKLKYAECPIAVYAEDENNERLGIMKHYPSGEEFVQVDYHATRKEWSLDPSMNLPQGGVRLGSVSSARSGNKATVISLQGVSRQEKIPRISWYYKDEEKSLFPGGVDVLLVIRKPNYSSPWFKFKLQLTKDLKVDVHGTTAWLSDFKDRFVGVPSRGDNGWNFIIAGRYNEDDARSVLGSLKDTPSIGLKAAARSMLAALSPRYNSPESGDNMLTQAS